MDIVNYFASNIPLFSICAVMVFIACRNINFRKRESINFLVFVVVVVILSIVVEMENYAEEYGQVMVGTIFTSLGYILRPILLCVFILLANMETKRHRSFYYICIIPLVVNLIIYLLPIIDPTNIGRVVFYYEMQENGKALFMRGSFLNFCSHLVCLLYLGILIYVSTMRFHGKHRRDGFVFIICVAIILTTVIVEMVLDRNDLLNIICGVCMMINYIFILSINSSKDPLTGLYDRRTYYEDIARYKELINGVIQMDMNELKNLNDTFGHGAGDVALIKISNILENSVNPSIMCVYRLSGDEFLILMFQGKEEDLIATTNKIKEGIEKSDYAIAVGSYYFDKKGFMTYESALKEAEKLMYQDKANYYKSNGHDRRRE